MRGPSGNVGWVDADNIGHALASGYTCVTAAEAAVETTKARPDDSERTSKDWANILIVAALGAALLAFVVVKLQEKKS